MMRKHSYQNQTKIAVGTKIGCANIGVIRTKNMMCERRNQNQNTTGKRINCSQTQNMVRKHSSQNQNMECKHSSQTQTWCANIVGVRGFWVHREF